MERIITQGLWSSEISWGKTGFQGHGNALSTLSRNEGPPAVRSLARRLLILLLWHLTGRSDQSSKSSEQQDVPWYCSGRSSIAMRSLTALRLPIQKQEHRNQSILAAGSWQPNSKTDVDGDEMERGVQSYFSWM